MTASTANRDLFRSITCTRPSSPTIINNKYKANSILSSCWGCSRTHKKSQQSNKYIQSDNEVTTIEDTKAVVHKDLFKRIQSFKGIVRLVRKLIRMKNTSFMYFHHSN